MYDHNANAAECSPDKGGVWKPKTNKLRGSFRETTGFIESPHVYTLVAPRENGAAARPAMHWKIMNAALSRGLVYCSTNCIPFFCGPRLC